MNFFLTKKGFQHVISDNSHYVNFGIGYGKISVYYKEYKWR